MSRPFSKRALLSNEQGENQQSEQNIVLDARFQYANDVEESPVVNRQGPRWNRIVCLGAEEEEEDKNDNGSDEIHRGACPLRNRSFAADQEEEEERRGANASDDDIDMVVLESSASYAGSRGALPFLLGQRSVDDGGGECPPEESLLAMANRLLASQGKSTMASTATTSHNTRHPAEPRAATVKPSSCVPQLPNPTSAASIGGSRLETGFVETARTVSSPSSSLFDSQSASKGTLGGAPSRSATQVVSRRTMVDVLAAARQLSSSEAQNQKPEERNQYGFTHAKTHAFVSSSSSVASARNKRCENEPSALSTSRSLMNLLPGRKGNAHDPSSLSDPHRSKTHRTQGAQDISDFDDDDDDDDDDESDTDANEEVVQRQYGSENTHSARASRVAPESKTGALNDPFRRVFDDEEVGMFGTQRMRATSNANETDAKNRTTTTVPRETRAKPTQKVGTRKSIFTSLLDDDDKEEDEGVRASARSNILGVRAVKQEPPSIEALHPSQPLLPFSQPLDSPDDLPNENEMLTREYGKERATIPNNAFTSLLDEAERQHDARARGSDAWSDFMSIEESRIASRNRASALRTRNAYADVFEFHSHNDTAAADPIKKSSYLEDMFQKDEERYEKNASASLSKRSRRSREEDVPDAFEVQPVGEDDPVAPQLSSSTSATAAVAPKRHSADELETLLSRMDDEARRRASGTVKRIRGDSAQPPGEEPDAALSVNRVFSTYVSDTCRHLSALSTSFLSQHPANATLAKVATYLTQAVQNALATTCRSIRAAVVDPAARNAASAEEVEKNSRASSNWLEVSVVSVETAYASTAIRCRVVRGSPKVLAVMNECDQLQRVNQLDKLGKASGSRGATQHASSRGFQVIRRGAAATHRYDDGNSGGGGCNYVVIIPKETFNAIPILPGQSIHLAAPFYFYPYSRAIVASYSIISAAVMPHLTSSTSQGLSPSQSTESASRAYEKDSMGYPISKRQRMSTPNRQRSNESPSPLNVTPTRDDQRIQASSHANHTPWSGSTPQPHHRENQNANQQQVYTPQSLGPKRTPFRSLSLESNGNAPSSTSSTPPATRHKPNSNMVLSMSRDSYDPFLVYGRSVMQTAGQVPRTTAADTTQGVTKDSIVSNPMDAHAEGMPIGAEFASEQASMNHFAFPAIPLDNPWLLPPSLVDEQWEAFVKEFDVDDGSVSSEGDYEAEATTKTPTVSPRTEAALEPSGTSAQSPPYVFETVQPLASASSTSLQAREPQKHTTLAAASLDESAMGEDEHKLSKEDEEDVNDAEGECNPSQHSTSDIDEHWWETEKRMNSDSDRDADDESTSFSSLSDVSEPSQSQEPIRRQRPLPPPPPQQQHSRINSSRPTFRHSPQRRPERVDTVHDNALPETRIVNSTPLGMTATLHESTASTASRGGKGGGGVRTPPAKSFLFQPVSISDGAEDSL